MNFTFKELRARISYGQKIRIRTVRTKTIPKYLTELCRETGLSKATLSALIKKLREKDYLYFLTDPDDVRKKKVLPTAKLTAEGKKFLERAERMESEICSALDQKEQLLFCKLERKLMARHAAAEHDENNEKNRQEVYLP